MARGLRRRCAGTTIRFDELLWRFHNTSPRQRNCDRVCKQENRSAVNDSLVLREARTAQKYSFHVEESARKFEEEGPACFTSEPCVCLRVPVESCHRFSSSILRASRCQFMYILLDQVYSYRTRTSKQARDCTDVATHGIPCSRCARPYGHASAIKYFSTSRWKSSVVDSDSRKPT